MKRALHIYASNGKNNSGDFMLGPSTRWHFSRNIIKEDIDWEIRDVRSPVNGADIDKFNSYDYIILGGGGLILPDTNHNNISCWQWAIPTPLLKKIKTPLYVISIGYNLFPTQTYSNDSKRYNTLKESLETLIEISTHFSLRHRGDCKHVRDIVDSSCHDQIKFEFCPTIEFVKYYMKKHNLSVDKRDIYAFEIKDDRAHMRYHKTSRDKYYSQLAKIVKYLQDHGKNVCYLSHDGSNSFKSYLNSKGIKVGSMSNAYSTAEKIILNYLKIDKLFCMAGHSQMIGHALDCDVISLISHNKQKYFLQDTDLYGRDRHVNVNTEDVYNKLLKICQQF